MLFVKLELVSRIMLWGAIANAAARSSSAFWPTPSPLVAPQRRELGDDARAPSDEARFHQCLMNMRLDGGDLRTRPDMCGFEPCVAPGEPGYGEQFLLAGLEQEGDEGDAQDIGRDVIRTPASH